MYYINIGRTTYIHGNKAMFKRAYPKLSPFEVLGPLKDFVSRMRCLGRTVKYLGET